MSNLFEEDENVVTIDEYIQQIEENELEADMVLGGDEGKECTYPNGYMKRQAVFSCLTCVPAGNAGVCTACSLACHDGHEVVELWTKRNFRCDCGNSKFGEFVCKLYNDKDPENPGNTYNHNFRGSYCKCVRPYPDPDAQEQYEMIQCCICEDWFHEEHLGLNSTDEIPRDEEGESLYEELICQDCAIMMSFLKLYPASVQALMMPKGVSPVNNINHEAVVVNDNIILENTDMNESNGNILTMVESASLTNLEDKNESNGNILTVVESASVTNLEDKSKDGDSSHHTKTEIDQKLHEVKICSGDEQSCTECIPGVDINLTPTVLEKKEPMFLSGKWRSFLCKCKTCYEFYKKKGIQYLLNKDDSIVEYENMAKRKREEKLQNQEGAELNFLNKLDHVQQIEISSAIADMKDEFRSFLESFDGSRPVTSADVHGIFENLSKKKRRLE